MKHLKIYENSKYFYEIFSIEFAMACNSVDNLSDSELFSIKSILGDGDYRLEEADSINDKKFVDRKFRSKLLIYLADLGPPSFVIIKLIDEWFVVRVYTDKGGRGIYTHYKCDQIEGLLECIKKSQSL